MYIKTIRGLLALRSFLTSGTIFWRVTIDNVLISVIRRPLSAYIYMILLQKKQKQKKNKNKKTEQNKTNM